MDDFSKDMTTIRRDPKIIMVPWPNFFPKIAIAIVTYNRPESFSVCLAKHKEFTPPSSKLFIVDGGSNADYANADYKFEHRATISEAKNKCLQLCYESGSDHIFLFDDDTFPIHIDWWKPYVKCKEHHLCYTFLPSSGTFTSRKLIEQRTSIDFCSSKELLRKSQLRFPEIKFENTVIKKHLLGNGCMLYFTRHCIETVGGFDTNYNNKYEHCDLSRRIYNARLTDNIYQDIQGSDNLIYCLDQDNKIPRSFTNREMQDNFKAGYDYFRSRENSSDYIEFRT